jgi:multidrug efflux pump subunit AcrA (membrane-fusion protein)
MSKGKKSDLIGKIIVIVLIAVFVAVGIFTMIGKNATSGTGGGMPGMSRGGGQGGNQPAAVTVSVKTLVPETIQKTVLLNGDVASKTQTSIYPDTSGKVSRLLKKVGDSVRRGEVIGYVDPSRPGSAYAVSPVTATVSGTVIQLPFNVGDTVNTSNALAVIGSLEDLELKVRVSEKYSSYLKTGLPAYVSLVSAPDTLLLAKVTSVSPVVNTSNRTQDVILTLDQKYAGIRPGMFAQVRLVVQEAQNTFVVPLDALRSYNDETAVFVVTADNIALRRIVQTGLANDNDIQITAGLMAGDQVIVAGSVTEGLPVRIAGR